MSLPDYTPSVLSPLFVRGAVVAGNRVRRFLALAPDMLAANVEADEAFIELDEAQYSALAGRFCYVDGGAVIAAGDPPSPHHRFDYTAKAWVDPRGLADHRAALLAQAKAERDRRLHGGMTWDGSAFDSDEISQTRLLGLFVSAQSAPGVFPVNWRLADNSWRSLSAADAAGVWAALQAHIQGLFGAFAAHEAAILALPDLASITSYDVTQGWPT